MRLSRSVETSDIEIAVKLLRHTIFQEDMGLGEQYADEESDEELLEVEEDKTKTNNSFAPRGDRQVGRKRVNSDPKIIEGTMGKKQ